MFRIYTKEKKSKEVFNVNLDSNELQAVMGGNLYLDHPELNPADYVVVEQDQPFTYPIYDSKKGTIEEATREQKILIFKEIDLLIDGEYIEKNKIVVVSAPENLLKKSWDRELHIWKEGATSEEIKEFYFNKINKFKAEILEVGFNFNEHQQKCREKDLALLGNAIAANEDAQAYSKTPVSHWSFNDNDVIEMSLEDLKRLRIAGATFVQAIFTVEAQLKASEANILLEKQDFIKKVDELSTVKCFKSSI